MLKTYDASGKLAAEYLLTSATPQTATTSYLTSDTLGSPRVITDTTGNVTSRRDFMPFGEEISGLGTRTSANGYQADSTRQKFTGYERDSESDLDFAEARYFNSGFGRFSSPDPLQASASIIRPQSWNRYSYSYNNPLKFSDPSGMLAGDFLENGSGKYLGTNEKKDGKYYVVTDSAEAKQIAKTNKQGGTTQLSQVTSIVDITSGDYGTRQAVGAAVVRSDSPNSTDKEGGFHEEAITIGPDVSGPPRAIDAKPGAVSDPLVDPHAQVVASDFANKADEGILQDLHSTAHVHPSGTKSVTTLPETTIGQTKIGGDPTSSGKFVQMPSQVDINNALPGKTNIVVGARDKTVYFYRNSGNDSKCNCVARIPLKVFLGLR